VFTKPELQKILKGRGSKAITIMTGWERMKLKKGIQQPIKARKVSSMINSVKQQNLKMNNAKNKKQSTKDSNGGG
jgi:hypothetical protein